MPILACRACVRGGASDRQLEGHRRQAFPTVNVADRAVGPAIPHRYGVRSTRGVQNDICALLYRIDEHAAAGAVAELKPDRPVGFHGLKASAVPVEAHAHRASGAPRSHGARTHAGHALPVYEIAREQCKALTHILLVRRMEEAW